MRLSLITTRIGVIIATTDFDRFFDSTYNDGIDIIETFLKCYTNSDRIYYIVDSLNQIQIQNNKQKAKSNMFYKNTFEEVKRMRQDIQETQHDIHKLDHYDSNMRCRANNCESDIKFCEKQIKELNESIELLRDLIDEQLSRTNRISDKVDTASDQIELLKGLTANVNMRTIYRSFTDYGESRDKLTQEGFVLANVVDQKEIWIKR